MAAGEASPWGNVCPLLRIAQHYEVPYAMTLYLADYMQHNRPIPLHAQEEVFTQAQPDVIDMVTQDVRWWSQHMRDIGSGAVRAF